LAHALQVKTGTGGKEVSDCEVTSCMIR